MYYVQRVGYVSGQFTRDDVNYPSNWLDSLSSEELESFGASKPPTYDASTQKLIQGETGWEVANKTQEDYNAEQHAIIAQREVDRNFAISNAWSAADNHAKQIDDNSRISILRMATDPNIPDWRKARIDAIHAWWDSIWSHYKDVKTRILNGEEASYDMSVAGNAPYSIWEVIEE